MVFIEGTLRERERKSEEAFDRRPRTERPLSKTNQSANQPTPGIQPTNKPTPAKPKPIPVNQSINQQTNTSQTAKPSPTESATLKVFFANMDPAMVDREEVC